MATVSKIQTSLTFEPVSGKIGAWVRGFELSSPDNLARTDALQRALAEYGVLFFDFGRVPDFDEYRGFASLFGKVQGKFDQVTKHRGVADFTGPRKLQRHTVDGEPLIGASA